jgi:hypothetical protein
VVTSPLCHSTILLLLRVTMNLLEDQVEDLNYLADTPIASISPTAVSGSMNGQRQSSSAESPADTGPGSGKKRKSDGTDANGNTHTRAKRNRYISIAWYICQLTKCSTLTQNPATNASGARSNVTATPHAKDAETSTSNVNMPRIAARMDSKSPRNSSK